MANEKISLNPIPLSLRGKKRYIKFELICKEKLIERDVSIALWKQFLQLFGELGTAKQKIWLVKFDSEKNQGVLRCALEEVEQVKAGLLFLKEVKGITVIPFILTVSGTIKGTE